MNARLLAFDTSTEALAVALQCDAGLFVGNVCNAAPGGAAASAQLLPQVRTLLQRGGITLAQLQAIAFGHGPGAFTGLRTACAVAQGLALGAALPLVPLDSLMIVAEAARAGAAAAGSDIDVVMDARMGEVYAGRYRWTPPRWQVHSEPELLTLDALHSRWLRQPPLCVAGSALQVFGDALRCGAALRAYHDNDNDSDSDRAAALARLAQQRWRDAGGIDAAAALPLYLRDKVALTTAERAALRRARA